MASEADDSETQEIAKMESAGRRSKAASSIRSVEGKDEKVHSPEILNKNEIPLWLAPCHLVAALFQGMQALFLFAFASQTDLQWLVYTNYPTSSADELLVDEYARPEPKMISSYSITWYAGFFILLSSIDHIFCVVPYFRQKYEYYIERHQAPSRWVEYSLSASLMRMHIAHVAGVTDVHILVLLYAITHVALYFPLLHEKLNARARADGFEQDWSPFYMGTIPHMVSWAVIFSYFFSRLSDDETPGHVTAIVFTLFLLDLSFPTFFYLQWKKIGIFENYLTGEFALIMCSFITKTILAWVTLSGANGFARMNGN